MSGPADIEACQERLHRSGWSIGDVGTSSGRLVSWANAEDAPKFIGSGRARG
jgi:hypothetical protein